MKTLPPIFAAMVAATLIGTPALALDRHDFAGEEFNSRSFRDQDPRIQFPGGSPRGLFKKGPITIGGGKRTARFDDGTIPLGKTMDPALDESPGSPEMQALIERMMRGDAWEFSIAFDEIQALLKKEREESIDPLAMASAPPKEKDEEEEEKKRKARIQERAATDGVSPADNAKRYRDQVNDMMDDLFPDPK